MIKYKWDDKINSFQIKSPFHTVILAYYQNSFTGKYTNVLFTQATAFCLFTGQITFTYQFQSTDKLSDVNHPPVKKHFSCTLCLIWLNLFAVWVPGISRWSHRMSKSYYTHRAHYRWFTGNVTTSHTSKLPELIYQYFWKGPVHTWSLDRNLPVKTVCVKGAIISIFKCNPR